MKKIIIFLLFFASCNSLDKNLNNIECISSFPNVEIYKRGDAFIIKTSEYNCIAIPSKSDYEFKSLSVLGQSKKELNRHEIKILKESLDCFKKLNVFKLEKSKSGVFIYKKEDDEGEELISN